MSMTDPPTDDNVELPAPVVVSTEPVLTRVPAAPPDRQSGPIRWIGILAARWSQFRLKARHRGHRRGRRVWRRGSQAQCNAVWLLVKLRGEGP